jgi:hypothetical protein
MSVWISSGVPASRLSQQRQARAGRLTQAPAPDSDVTTVPHELSEHVEGDLGLAIALYRVMPCYGNLMYVGHWAGRERGKSS